MIWILLAVQIILTTLALVGAHRLGRESFKRLGLGAAHLSISYLFVGLLPALLFEVLLSVFAYQGLSLPFGFLPHFLFLGFGIFDVIDRFKKNQFPQMGGRALAILILFLAIVYLPTLALPPRLHPSWDSDAIDFWLPKALQISRMGHLNPLMSDAHPDYFSFFNRSIGHLVGPIAETLIGLHETAPTLVVFRIVSFVVAIWGLAAFSKGWSTPLQLAFLTIALSGFPIKWINGYQDNWVAFFLLGYLACVLRGFALEAAIYLALVASSKNEGLLVAALFALFLPLKNPRTCFVFLGFVTPVLIWKLFSKLHGFTNNDLALQNLSPEILVERLHLWRIQLFKGLGRAFQSYWLDGLIASILLGIFYKQLAWRERALWLAALAAVFVPQFVVLLSPHDYQWHLETTFSRISTAGLLSLVYLAFAVVNGACRPQSLKRA